MSNHFLAMHLVAVLMTVQSQGISTQPIAHSMTPMNQVSLNFRPPSGQGAPSGRARGGASRGSCPDTALPVTALVPLATNTAAYPEQDVGAAVGLTTQIYPTLWFYIPFALSAERTVEFSLLDAEGNYLYKTTISSSSSAGILGIELPHTIPPLTAETTYSWIVQVNCDTANPISIWGNLRRIALEPALARQLEQASLRERAALYAEHGIWYEALTTLAQGARIQPSDPEILADWQDLLRSAGLADLAEQPVLP